MDIAAILVILAFTIGSVSFAGFHTIREGHLGLYYRGGALLERATNPGLNWQVPLLDSHAEVQVTVQTDHVSNIACGTSSGVVITFDRVEVVNRLRRELALETIRNYTVNYDKPWIFDKVHHEINQLCSRKTLKEIAITEFDRIDEMLLSALVRDASNFAPGIEIISVRVTKPRLPASISGQFESMEAEKAKLEVEEQRRRVVQAAAQTDKLKRTIEAERDSEIAAIEESRKVASQQAEATREQIRNDMHLAAERSRADAEAYQIKSIAAANSLLHTPAYLELQKFGAVTANAKIYFGDKIPTAMVGDWGGGGTAAVSATDPTCQEPSAPSV